LPDAGVPHTEVDLILVNGRSVGFDHRLEDGDRVSVYPVFEALDVTPVVRLRPRPLREPRFVLDELALLAAESNIRQLLRRYLAPSISVTRVRALAGRR
jgi:hypothetical protein